MKTTTFLLFTVLLILISPIHAQTPTTATNDYPTVDALKQAVVPVADAVDLARRFKGVHDLPAPPVNPVTRQVGEVEQFWIENTDENREFQVSATLRVVGEHIYMWVQSEVRINTDELQQLANAFDTNVYPKVHKLWGSEASPGIDGDTRLYGLFVRHLGGSVAAYFSSRNTFPKQVWPTSNQHEMFLFNLDTLGSQNLANTQIESVVAHELQHMIRFNLERNEDIWLNEGFSTFTQLLLYQDTSSIPYFLYNPHTQLNDWPPDAASAPHYGAANLFVAYFYERFGEAGLRKLSQEPERGLDAFDHVLKDIGEKGVNDFFADWVLANFLVHPKASDGRYGHKLLPVGFVSAAPIATVNTYPYRYTGTLNQYATDYHMLTDVGGKQALDIQVEAPTTAMLIPFNAPSGQWMWYSNRADLSDMRLTRNFDLTSVKAATLNYKVWYDTEQYYDYGYVTVSADGGKSWQIIKTPNSDNSNPVSNAYGPGYTGVSGGWRDEQVSLSAYSGQNIQLRFEFIADDSTTSKGMAIDAVSIPEIGYQNDFEQDDGGWQAEGWVRTDNRLPQQIWVQAVQQVDDQVLVKRWLAPAESDWQLPIESRSNSVLIAISPFAPVTTTPTTYTLAVQ
ncbi:MAG: hypothetical protein GC179_00465 [Anaerolineaceae bacterium]|nr:hypothetical protein [Anaerolineaceae bacterium]